MSGAVFTLAEAAAHLRLTNRGVAKIARKHGLCMVRGRDILFTDADIEAIKDVLRVAPKVPRSPTVKTPPSDYQMLQRLLAATKKKSRKRQNAK